MSTVFGVAFTAQPLDRLSSALRTRGAQSPRRWFGSVPAKRGDAAGANENDVGLAPGYRVCLATVGRAPVLGGGLPPGLGVPPGLGRPRGPGIPPIGPNDPGDGLGGWISGVLAGIAKFLSNSWCRDVGRIVRCAIWPFFFCICWVVLRNYAAHSRPAATARAQPGSWPPKSARPARPWSTSGKAASGSPRPCSGCGSNGWRRRGMTCRAEARRAFRRASIKTRFNTSAPIARCDSPIGIISRRDSAIQGQDAERQVIGDVVSLRVWPCAPARYLGWGLSCWSP